MPSSTVSARRTLGAPLVALAPAASLEAQNPRTQPAPPPRSATNDSGRTRTLATDTTRNRAAANQDSIHAQEGDSANPRPGVNGIRLRSIGPGMVSGRITDLAVNPRDKNI